MEFEPKSKSVPVFPFDFYCPSVIKKMKDNVSNLSFILYIIGGCGDPQEGSHPKKYSTLNSILHSIECVVQQSGDSMTSTRNDVDIDVISNLHEFLASPFENVD